MTVILLKMNNLNKWLFIFFYLTCSNIGWILRSGRSQQNYYWTINNQGINVITIVSRRKKIVAITQVNHDDPYLLINLLLLPRQTFFLSQSMSLVNTYTLFLTAFFSSYTSTSLNYDSCVTQAYHVLLHSFKNTRHFR